MFVAEKERESLGIRQSEAIAEGEGGVSGGEGAPAPFPPDPRPYGVGGSVRQGDFYLIHICPVTMQKLSLPLTVVDEI